MAAMINYLDLSSHLHALHTAAQGMGVRIEIGYDFDEYLALTRTIPGKSTPIPTFRPDCCAIAPGCGFWMKGIDAYGCIAHVQAARVDDLGDQSLAEHIGSLRACYTDVRRAGPGARCICDAPSARNITGRVAYQGDVWIREDYRGREMLRVFSPMLFALALAMWSPDVLYGLVPLWSVQRGVVERYGYPHKEPRGSVLTIPSENINDDDWITWITRDELIEAVNRAIYRSDAPHARIGAQSAHPLPPHARFPQDSGVSI